MLTSFGPRQSILNLSLPHSEKGKHELSTGHEMRKMWRQRITASLLLPRKLKSFGRHDCVKNAGTSNKMRRNEVRPAATFHYLSVKFIKMFKKSRGKCKLHESRSFIRLSHRDLEKYLEKETRGQQFFHVQLCEKLSCQAIQVTQLTIILAVFVAHLDSIKRTDGWIVDVASNTKQNYDQIQRGIAIFRGIFNFAIKNRLGVLKTEWREFYMLRTNIKSAVVSFLFHFLARLNISTNDTSNWSLKQTTARIISRLCILNSLDTSLKSVHH